jgi:TonB family protein
VSFLFPHRGAFGSFSDPRLEAHWAPRRGSFAENLRALVRGPRAPRRTDLRSFFPDADIRQPIPQRALAASFGTHVLLLWVLLLPIWARVHWGGQKPQLALPQIELTWYQPGQDLPLLSPLGPPHRPSPRGARNRPLPPRGADAYNPRQTILSFPMRITHPRQLLIEPAAPQQAPKILPPLPNIVQLAPTPVVPPPRIAQSTASPVAEWRTIPNVPLPEIPIDEKHLAELNIASSPLVNGRPLMPLAPSSAHPMATDHGATEEGAAPALPLLPDGSAPQEIIALSTTPAPPPPKLEVPSGNLSARFSISPDGLRRGVPGGSPNGAAGANGGTGGDANSAGGLAGGGGKAEGTGGGAHGGPEGLSISGGNNRNGAPGNESGGEGRGLAPRHNPRAALRIPIVPIMPNSRSLAAGDAPVAPLKPGGLAPGMKPEEILGHKRIYTLYVNMPNLTSATGSWILNFAELTAGGPQLPTDLTGPVPIRKVDPKYPPALKAAHVEGEVILYAIIRADGSVDSIQVLHSVDPQLDQYAVQAFARWKFRPAMKDDEPVALESIVRIPFRAEARL